MSNPHDAETAMPQSPDNSASVAHGGAQAHWENVYQTKAVDQVSWHQDSAGTSLRLIGPRREPRGTGRAVDVGAGRSPLLDALLAAGWGHVTALDVSATALDVLRRRVGEHDPRATYVVTDVLAWHPDSHYDLWHDRAALHFLTEPAERAATVRRPARVRGRDPLHSRDRGDRDALHPDRSLPDVHLG